MIHVLSATTGMGTLAHMVMAASLPTATFLVGLTRHQTGGNRPHNSQAANAYPRIEEA